MRTIKWFQGLELDDSTMIVCFDASVFALCRYGVGSKGQQDDPARDWSFPTGGRGGCWRDVTRGHESPAGLQNRRPACFLLGSNVPHLNSGQFGFYTKLMQWSEPSQLLNRRSVKISLGFQGQHYYLEPLAWASICDFFDCANVFANNRLYVLKNHSFRFYFVCRYTKV